MKKFFVFTVFLVVMSAVTAVQAEVRAGSFSVTPFAGGYFFEGNQNIKDSYTIGLRAGYNLTENLGVEGFFSYVPTKFKDPDDKNDVYVCGIEGIYHFLSEGSFVPFVAIGVGAFHYSDGRSRFAPTNFAVDYGAGVKFFITDNVALRADVRHVMPLNDKYNDLLVSLGVNFAFGGKKKVYDSDQDGVFDDVDKCPDTPLGVKVDKDGCPLDSDKDGVPDYLDKCPGTPVGCTVDKNGCPIDSDKDGVIDCRDKCPNTPAGAKVDKDGCSREKISISLNVQFDTAKADIKGKYHNNIKRVADFMKTYPNTNTVIEGHTDKVGKEAYNIRLSKARADSVKQYLVDKFGIDASAIETIGYGPKKPVAGNDTSEGKQKNRRVDAVLETMLVK